MYGSETVIVVPLPTSLSIDRSPEKSATVCLTNTKPSEWSSPSRLFRSVRSCWIFASGIPEPVSRTRSTTRSPSTVALIFRMPTFRSFIPSTAFMTRLKNILRNR